MKIIQDRCIITNSDNNVGISILPPEWDVKKYKSQIFKGDHKKVEISGQECLVIYPERSKHEKKTSQMTRRK